MSSKARRSTSARSRGAVAAHPDVLEAVHRTIVAELDALAGSSDALDALAGSTDAGAGT
jgi:hypothetical protein